LRPTIRELRSSDIPAIIEIDVVSFPPSEQYDEAFYEHLPASVQYHSVVALDDNGVVAGYASLDVLATPPRITSIAVDPARRRCGVGAALMRTLVERAGTMELYVDPGNTAAIALYERLGFVVDATRLGWRGKAVMRLREGAPPDE